MANYFKQQGAQPSAPPPSPPPDDFIARGQAIDDEARRKLPETKRGEAEADEEARRRLRDLGRVK